MSSLTHEQVALLEEHSRDALEVSDHQNLALIAVGLCLLPEPPAWARENRDVVRDLGAHAARDIAHLEADPFRVALELVSMAGHHRLALGDPTWTGPADQREVDAAAALAGALDALAGLAVGIGVGRSEEAPTGSASGPAARALSADVLAVLERHGAEARTAVAIPIASALCPLPGAPGWAVAVREEVSARPGGAALVAAYVQRPRMLFATLVREAEEIDRVVPDLADALLALAGAFEKGPPR